jgi:hypothetical protein
MKLSVDHLQKEEELIADIARKYAHFKPVLLRQLKQYDPQIIIFGSTFQHFQNDLGIKDEELTNYYKDKKKPRYIVKNGKLYVDAYHPAARELTMTEADYVQSIIDIVEMNKENIECARWYCSMVYHKNPGFCSGI